MSIWLVENSIKDSQVCKVLEKFFSLRVIRTSKSLLRLLNLDKSRLPRALVLQEENSFRNISLASITNQIRIPIFYIGEGVNEKSSDNVWHIPFLSGAELQVGFKIRSVLDRSESIDQQSGINNLILDPENLSVTIPPDNQPVPLTMKEYRILSFLLSHPNVCLSRDEIIKNVWGKTKVSSRTVDSYISRLRSKIEYSGLSIENQYGGGYVLA